MPRDGSGIYSVPPGTDGVSNQTVLSTPYNNFVHDVEADANAPRPIIAGGTGATSAAQARDQTHLQTERATQTIVNFDADPLEPGSFTAATTALGSPVAGHAFAGIVFGPDASNLFINAHDQDDTAVPVRVYTRQKKTGVWGAWALSGGSGAVRYDSAQTLTASPQQEQARKNIYAAPFDAMAYYGMQFNGAMTFSLELGATGTATSGAYALDGFRNIWAYAAGGRTFTLTQVQASSFPVPLPGFATAMRFVASGALTLNNGDYGIIRTQIEGYRTGRLGMGAAGAQPFSIAFYYYSDATDILVTSYTSGGANHRYAVEHPIVGGQWNLCTATILPDTNGGAAEWPSSNTTGMYVDLFIFAKTATPSAPGSWVTGGLTGTRPVTNTLSTSPYRALMTGLFLIPGSEVPAAPRMPFIQRPVDEEYRQCRYFWNRWQTVHRFASTGAGAISNWTGTFQTPMRTNPTLTITPGSLSGNVDTSSWPYVQQIDWQTYKHELRALAAGDCWALNNSVTADARL